MRISPLLPATIAILLSACGLGEAEGSGSPIVPTTTTTTTTIVGSDEPVPDELAPADDPGDAPDTSVAGDSASITTTAALAQASTTVAPTTTTAVAESDPIAVFCSVLADVARLNPHQATIETDADAYANYIRWEIEQLEMVDAPTEVAGDFASYVEAERRTLGWIVANGASLADVRALGSQLESTLDIVELSDRVSRYFAFLRRECPQF